jgi:hypothetical protein
MALKKGMGRLERIILRPRLVMPRLSFQLFSCDRMNSIMNHPPQVTFVTLPKGGMPLQAAAKL